MVDGAVNGDVFSAFVHRALVPTLRSGDLVVMDNLSSYKVKGVREAIESVGAGLMFLLELIFLAVPHQLVSALTDIPKLLDAAPPLVRLCGYVQFFFGSALVLQGAMRGAGDTRTPAILSNSLTWGFRLPLAVFFGLDLDLGLYGIWIALCSELLVRGLAFIACSYGKEWLKAKV